MYRQHIQNSYRRASQSIWNNNKCLWVMQQSSFNRFVGKNIKPLPPPPPHSPQIRLTGGNYLHWGTCVRQVSRIHFLRLKQTCKIRKFVLTPDCFGSFNGGFRFSRGDVAGGNPQGLMVGYHSILQKSHQDDDLMHCKPFTLVFSQ